ncbi:SCO-spondin-like [Haliotis asinina]|uniref:SCO-spondin-like n=1 Tax=Haliotis asinina TaxID=109174 RepID=UPI0035322C5A
MLIYLLLAILASNAAAQTNLSALNRDCHSIYDAVLVVDGSESIGASNFITVKRALMEFINTTLQTNEDVHVGVVLYSTAVTETVNMTHDWRFLDNKIENMSYPARSTFTDHGIDSATDMLLTQGRKVVPRIMIVVTDGLSTRPERTLEAAQRAKDSSITIYTVGIEFYVKRNAGILARYQSELESIASDEGHVIHLSDFQTFEDTAPELAEKFCAVIAEVLTGLQNLTVYEGERFNLTAEMSHIAVVGGNWSQNGKLLNAGGRYSISKNGSFLSFYVQGAQLSDAGNYTFTAGGQTAHGFVTVLKRWSDWSEWSQLRCRATCGVNIIGDRERTRTCEKPECVGNNSETETGACTSVAPCDVSFTTELNNVTVRGGDDFTLTATVSDTDKTDWQWSKGGTVLTESGRIKFVQDGSGKYSLNVIGAETADEGEYTFSIGGKSTKGYVTVTAEILDGLKDIRVRQGDNISQAVLLVGSGYSGWRWMKDGVAITENDRIKFGSGDSSYRMEVIGARLADSGKYSFIVARKTSEGTVTVYVDGGWSEWAAWTLGCSSDCSSATATDTRSRTCSNPAPVNNGSTCSGNAEDQRTVQCDTSTCVSFTTQLNNVTVQSGGDFTLTAEVSGTTSSAGEWSLDGRVLAESDRMKFGQDGSGKYTLGVTGATYADDGEYTFTIGGKSTKGTVTVVVDGGWDAWTTWHIVSCSATCGVNVAGVSRRVRYCDKPTPRNGGKDCEGERVERNATTCELPECIILSGLQNLTLRAGEVMTMNAVTKASVTGAAEWYRHGHLLHDSSRVGIVKDNANHTLTLRDLTVGDTGAYTFSIEGQTAEGHLVVVADGGWSVWTSWKRTCSATCGNNLPGTRARNRTCDNPAPANGGNDCDGSASENITAVCNLGSCETGPVDGGWDEWTSWRTTSCSATCGVNVAGELRRVRYCDHPRPRNGGAECVGERVQTNTTICSTLPKCLILVGPKNVTLRSGEKLTLTADVDESVHSKAEWLQKGKALHPDTRVKIYHDKGNNTITVDQVTDADSGAYTFRIEGHTSAGYVTVIVDGGWGAWTEWVGSCTVTCGNNITVQRKRNRTCDNPTPASGGNDCAGDATEETTTPCDVPPCVPNINGGWSEWSSATRACSATCGQSVSGTDTRTRTCTNPVPSGTGSQCVGASDDTQTVTCPDIICPVNGGWSLWTTWARVCDADCGVAVSGTDTRSRTCTNPVPAGTGRPCEGERTQINSITCQVQECPVVFRQGLQDVRVPIGETVALTAALTTAGHTGWTWQKDGVALTEKDNVKFSENGDSYGLTITGAGVADSGTYTFTVGGKKSEATVTVFADGSWSNWGSWRRFCFASCGVADGVDNRTRACNNPAPSNGGAACPGKAVDSKDAQCVLPPCPNIVDGGWSEWGEWVVVCAGSCGSVNGEANRTRTCDNPPPSTSGRPCSGGYIQRRYQVCHLDACIGTVNGGWSEWSSATRACSATCGQSVNGTDTRTRTCTNPVPVNGGRVCSGNPLDTQIVTCQVPTCDNGQVAIVSGVSDTQVEAGGPIVLSAQLNQPVETNWQWLKDGVPVSQDSRNVMTRNGNVYRLTRLQAAVSDTGNYTFIAGGATSDGSVTVYVNGGWSEWSSVTRACSATCGQSVNGTDTRTRTCTNPVPVNGGRVCSGNPLDTQIVTCQVPTCENSCGFVSPDPDNPEGFIVTVGNISQKLSCTAGTSFNPTSCLCDRGQVAIVSGVSDTQVEAGGPIVLSAELNQPVETNWQWLKDGVPVSQDSRNVMTRNGNVYRLTRLQAAVSDTGNYTFIAGGATSDGSVTVYVNGGWSEWSSVTRACSATCGQSVNGTDTRTRTCTNPVPVNGGRACSGNPLDTQIVTCQVPTCENSCGFVSPDPDNPEGFIVTVGNISQKLSCTAGTSFNPTSCLCDRVNGGWGPWSAFRRYCSGTCGSVSGIQNRTRECNNPPPRNGGAQCAGESVDQAVVTCSLTPCSSKSRQVAIVSGVSDTQVEAGGPIVLSAELNQPVETNWQWLKDGVPVSQDSRNVMTRNGNVYRLTRLQAAVSDTGNYTFIAGGATSDGSVTVYVNGGWSEWSSVTRACSATCGQSVNGTDTRTRTCTNPVPVNGGRACSGNPLDTQIVTCQVPTCDNGWGEWSFWRRYCSATCGGQVFGVENRTRVCLTQPCTGESSEQRNAVCTLDPCTGPCSTNSPDPDNAFGYILRTSSATYRVNCPGGNLFNPITCLCDTSNQLGSRQTGLFPVLGSSHTGMFRIQGWGEWSFWRRYCSATCGGQVSGVENRTRVCLMQPCTGESSEQRNATCTLDPCTGRCAGWGEWSFWRRYCSATCGGQVFGVENRTRVCLTQPCTGESSEQRNAVCTLDPCTGRCAGWGEWSFWRRYCSATCGGQVFGVENRTRVCLTQPCTGESSEQRNAVCTLDPCTGRWGEWGQWSSWTPQCTGSCAAATLSQFRRRTCTTTSCSGRGFEQRDYVCPTPSSCNGTVNGGWGVWGNWTRESCSASCGELVTGTVRRERRCDNPRPTGNGLPCFGKSFEIKDSPCSVPACPLSQVGLCSDVFNASGVGYRYHPTACDKYLQCYYGPGGEVRGLYRTCPFGHHWDQLTRRCNNVWEVDCPMEKCRSGNVLSYAMDGNCRGFWSCDSNGRAAAECCPEGYRYTTRGCKPDFNCQDHCPSSCFGTGVCDKLPVWGDSSKFQIDGGQNGWLSADCPNGTEFSILECACMKRRNHDCSPQAFVVFDEAFINSTSWVRASNMRFQGGIAQFGQGRIDVDLTTAAATPQNPQVLFLRYREAAQMDPTRQVLVSGTDCNGKENLVIALENRHLVFEITSWVGTTHSVTMATQGFPLSDWKDVILMYNGNTMVGIIKSDKTRFFSHTLAPKSSIMECGVTLGTDLTRTRNFMGEITMLDIYQCDPDYLT